MDNKKEPKKKDNNDFFIVEYNKVFETIGVDPERLRQEWKKEGDTFHQFTLFEDQPTPILTHNTYSI